MYNKKDFSDVKEYPAPWHLKGKGYILLYKFSKEEIQNDKFLSDKFKKSFLGGFGAVMIVDYAESDAGPYSELLFIPGKFRYGRKKKNTISKIYVSSRESIMNGRENWAIPKEHADFTFAPESKHIENINISSKGEQILTAKIKSGRLIFPVNTAFLPFPLVQEQDGKAFYTKFSGSGKGRFASIKEITINPELFPIAASKKPLLAVKVEPFKICFPESEIGDIE